ncbi:MAG: GNAT family N-acetyltransferase [Legionellales bacterium]|nr:GNAT family N-acetyltransferase [Legionellales bacterium]
MITLPLTLKLRAIQENDNVKLSLGNPSYTPLKTFLKKDALDFHTNDIAKTYVLIEPVEVSQKVWGYVTLMSSEIHLNGHQKPEESPSSVKYDVLPAVKIARLAVDQKLQRKGYGKGLVEFCVSLVMNKITPHIGCRYIVVDAKQESVNFYTHLGFELLTTQNNQEEAISLLFFDIHRYKAVLDAT